jgi:phosphoenolpyruvate synthase/pyruvate phosphate dikinase
MIKLAIQGAKMNKRKIGICGQAPSDFPDFAEFLLKNKIDSISGIKRIIKQYEKVLLPCLYTPKFFCEDLIQKQELN